MSTLFFIVLVIAFVAVGALFYFSRADCKSTNSAREVEE
jgi:hypothetical protein